MNGQCLAQLAIIHNVCLQWNVIMANQTVNYVSNSISNESWMCNVNNGVMAIINY